VATCDNIKCSEQCFPWSRAKVIYYECKTIAIMQFFQRSKRLCKCGSHCRGRNPARKQFQGIELGHPIPGEYKYGCPTLQFRGVSHETAIYGYGSFATLTSEWCALQNTDPPLVREGALHEEASTCQTKEHVKSGHEPQGAVRHQDMLTDWPSVAYSTPLNSRGIKKYFSHTKWNCGIFLSSTRQILSSPKATRSEERTVPSF
jgi:hypothetical protein